MDHQSARDHIIEKMRKELPDTLRYHALDHTLEVITSAERIALAEGIKEPEMETLLTAAAFHDCGFLRTYEDHEEMSCVIAEEILPQYGCDDEELKVIKAMIMSTRVPQASDTVLGRILCDADLDYLGGEDYDRVSQSLLNELMLNGYDLSYPQWLNVQIGFLEGHRFWTEHSKNLHRGKKERILERLRKEQQTLEEKAG